MKYLTRASVVCALKRRFGSSLLSLDKGISGWSFEANSCIFSANLSNFSISLVYPFSPFSLKSSKALFKSTVIVSCYIKHTKMYIL